MAKKELIKVDTSGALTNRQVIFKAMIIYMQTPGLALRKLWESRRIDPDDDESPLFCDSIPFRTLKNAMTTDKWAVRRDEHWAGIEQEVLARLKTSTVEQEMVELSRLQAVEGLLLDHVTGVTDEHGNVVLSPARPKSLEGVVAAVVNLGKYRDGKRNRVHEHIAMGAAPVQETEVIDVTPHVEDRLTDEDIEAMALALARQRAGLPPLIEDQDGDE